MKKDPIDSWLTPLESIENVEAPPFLFTRIGQTIGNRERERMPKGKLVLAGCVFCILLLLNVLVLLRNDRPVKGDSSIRSLGLLPDNDLYK